MRLVPGSDLVAPAHDGAAELADLGWAVVASGVAGVEQPEELGAGRVVEAFVGHGQQAPRSIQRVGLVAPVAEGVVLHSAAGLVEALVGELHHVEQG